MTTILKNIRLLKLGEAILYSVILMLICYFVDNSGYSILGDATVGQHIEQLRLMLGKKSDTLPDDVYLINVAYDRQLIPLKDTLEMTKGNIDITDRQRLVDLLTEMKSADYKYVILDVLFDEKWHTPADSTLYALISSMDNIVVAKTATAKIADEIPTSKLRFSDYSKLILESNFVKYEYIRMGEPTLPYQMYVDLYGNQISRHGWFYFFNGLPAYKSVVLRHPVKLWDDKRQDSSIAFGLEARYHNLGSDILDAGIDIPEVVKDKIVVIGDFCEEDMHETYLGQIAGPVIIINAYLALIHDDLSIPVWLIVFLFLFYTAISYCIICRYSLRQSIPFLNKIKSKSTLLIISFCSLSTLMTVVAGLLYIIFHIDIDIFIPSAWFTGLYFIYNLSKRINEL